MVTPSAGLFQSYQAGLSNLDIATVEVVRGPAGVLLVLELRQGLFFLEQKAQLIMKETQCLFGLEKCQL